MVALAKQQAATARQLTASNAAQAKQIDDLKAQIAKLTPPVAPAPTEPQPTAPK